MPTRYFTNKGKYNIALLLSVMGVCLRRCFWLHPYRRTTHCRKFIKKHFRLFLVTWLTWTYKAANRNKCITFCESIKDKLYTYKRMCTISLSHLMIRRGKIFFGETARNDVMVTKHVTPLTLISVLATFIVATNSTDDFSTGHTQPLQLMRMTDDQLKRWAKPGFYRLFVLGCLLAAMVDR